jgi:3-hydroxyacyl-CoA dehydrogenase
LPVVLIDTNEDALAAARSMIAATLSSGVVRGRLGESEAARQLSLVTTSTSLAAAGSASIVIEAIYDDMALKQATFRELDRVCRPDAVLATNSSYLDVNTIAAATARPSSVLGMHFFSPANVMKLVEVVRGEATSPGVLLAVRDFALRLGKVPVQVEVCDGFAANRMARQRRREADALLSEGCHPAEVDKAMRGFGFRMGPFQARDLAGLDVGWSAERSTGATMQERLCEAGRRGQKTGAGYYDYVDGAREATRSPVVEGIIAEFVRERGATPRTFEPRQIVDRLVLAIINEAALVLSEGIVQRPSDIDVIWVHGYGWPDVPSR